MLTCLPTPDLHKMHLHNATRPCLHRCSAAVAQTMYQAFARAVADQVGAAATARLRCPFDAPTRPAARPGPVCPHVQRTGAAAGAGPNAYPQGLDLRFCPPCV